MKIEIAYKGFGEIKAEKLAEARQTELEGRIDEAKGLYTSAVRELEFQLFAENGIEKACYRKSDAWRDELLAKIELAKGKSKEIAGEDSTAEYQKSYEHYNDLVELLNDCSGADSKVKAGYAKQAVSEIKTILGENNNKESKDDNLEIIAKMPTSLSEKLKPVRFGFFDMYYRHYPEGITQGETEDYYVVVAKWTQTSYSDMGGGTGYEELLEVYFAKKGSDELLMCKTEPIATRDMSDARRDKKHLDGFHGAGLEVLEGNKIKICWKNDKGEEGPSYIFNLDEEPNKGD